MAIEIDYTNQVALVTGATRGIGKAIAERLYQAGAELILTGTNPEKIANLNEKSRRDNTPRLVYICVDFGDPDATDTFIEKLSTYQRIDVCVNNAGTNRNNPLEKTRTQDFELLMDINLRAPYLICRALAGMMKRNGYGRIINIASIWSIVSKSERSIYTMTKAGLAGLTRTMAAELSSHNVLVNTVSPGFTLTELTRKTLPEKDKQALMGNIPAGRFAEPVEVANLILFLGSNLNSYIAGQNIAIDGGFTNV